MQLGVGGSWRGVVRAAVDLAETGRAAPECSWLKSWAKLEDGEAAGRPRPSEIAMVREAIVFWECRLARWAGVAIMACLLSGRVVWFRQRA